MELNVHFEFPEYLKNKVAEIKVFFAFDRKTRKHEAYVPMPFYLELLEEVHDLKRQLAHKEIKLSHKQYEADTFRLKYENRHVSEL